MGGYSADNKNGFIQFYKEDGTIGALIKGENNTYFNGGNVGIGINDPQDDLHIAGVLRMDRD